MEGQQEQTTPYRVLVITLINGEVDVYKDEEYDDYHYDRRFFSITKGTQTIAMYNLKKLLHVKVYKEGDYNLL